MSFPSAASLRQKEGYHLFLQTISLGKLIKKEWRKKTCGMCCSRLIRLQYDVLVYCQEYLMYGSHAHFSCTTDTVGGSPTYGLKSLFLGSWSIGFLVSLPLLERGDKPYVLEVSSDVQFPQSSSRYSYQSSTIENTSREMYQRVQHRPLSRFFWTPHRNGFAVVPLTRLP